MRVVKLAQPGFDVKTAGDENLIYNSNWPLLKIVKSGTFNTTNVTQQTIVYKHNLGYPPMFWVYSNQPITSWNLTHTTPKDNRSEFLGIPGGFLVKADSTNLYVVPNPVTPFNANVSFEYYIFALDLTQNFTSPQIKTGGVGGVPGDTVFKIAKEGKDTSSHALEDYVIHSHARSPLVHSVTTGKVRESLGATGFAFTVYHNLGYNPMFFGFVGVNGLYSPSGTGGGGTSLFTSNEQIVRRQDTVQGTEDWSIIVLKDPFLIDYSRSVSV